MRAGPVFITPTLNVESYYTDNLFRTETDQLSSWVLETRPEVQAWVQNGLNTYSLTYKLEDYRYSKSGDDDFTDHNLQLDLHQEFTARNSLNLRGEYFNGHEERGSGLIEGELSGLTDNPVEVDWMRYGGDYTYGTRGSGGRLNLAYDYYDREYQNYRTFTRFRDYEQNAAKGTFFWALAPRTDLLAEVRYADTAYDKRDPLNPSGSYDSEEFNYFLGAQWEASARTTGSVRLGWYDRSYDSSGRDNDQGFSWEVDMEYLPRSYSVLSLATRRFTRETNARGDAIDSKEYTASWNHQWSGRSTTNLKLLFAEDDFAGSDRDDDRWWLEASYSRSFARWFDLGGGYRYEQRDSTVSELDYDRNVYFVEAVFSL